MYKLKHDFKLYGHLYNHFLSLSAPEIKISVLRLCLYVSLL